MGDRFGEGYLATLRERRARSKPISRSSQATGLLLADILHDRGHKHLYLRLAREYDNGALISLAKDVAERKNVANYGAYFMRRFQQTKATLRRVSSPKHVQRKLPLRRKRAKKT